LAQDLVVLADLYETRRSTLKRDKNHYDKKHPIRARAIAGEIFGSVTDENEADDGGRNELLRGVAFLLDVYAQVPRGGRFLYADDEDVDALFPSLVHASRKPSKGDDESDEAAKKPA